MMNIGFCGSHRTGKTTLAEAIHEKTGMPLVKTTTTNVFKEWGLDPSKPIDFTKRLWIQQKILITAEKIWSAQQGDFITDRTPLDMAAYTLADIQGATKLNFIELESYLGRCFDITNQFFKSLILIQPGIPLIFEEGKAALSKGYLEHLNFLIMGLCNDERVKAAVYRLPRALKSFDDRVKTVLNVVNLKP